MFYDHFSARSLLAKLGRRKMVGAKKIINKKNSLLYWITYHDMLSHDKISHVNKIMSNLFIEKKLACYFGSHIMIKYPM